MGTQRPRGDTLLRAVVAAFHHTGYQPTARQSTARASQVVLRRVATAANDPGSVCLAITHHPQRHCLQVDLGCPVAPGAAWVPQRTVYDYYVAQHPEDLSRIAAGILTVVGLPSLR